MPTTTLHLPHRVTLVTGPRGFTVRLRPSARGLWSLQSPHLLQRAPCTCFAVRGSARHAVAVAQRYARRFC